jgi:MinD-like ATPase involved in chromosome partitioning or flagellar assembly
LHTIFNMDENIIKNDIIDLIDSPTLDISHTLYDLTLTLPNVKPGGKLVLLPAVTAPSKLNIAMGAEMDTVSFLNRIVGQIEEEYNPHYIFIDSRSGFSEMATPTFRIAQKMVFVMRPNKQNAIGLKLLLGILDAVAEPLRTPYFLVLSQVPDVPGIDNRLERFYTLLASKYSIGTKIPYNPELALEEKVISILSPLSDDSTSYHPIINWLTNKN